ncbi:TetR/AcrR family transcriptional regulator [Gordonia sp. L191]|uniref:TetR/AcrR family transcriptional regulator n=1 Tax=unclassified Gordonia (in: high G+C Gram-positive bacteria) TaxID=2657482 RepID=UPI001556CEFF|nr:MULTISPECIES: TetR/AcrR family transcriptional regulator [unclassified Gordonia (in: high G+C Gram-positive bacteria)]MDF3281359.1 TetR/AcrR family transcriptional regulator [Gordonia sp. N1V]WHU47087.1 TetR/AcrR family transcriptional regulator [Gordonia sp. L191]
MAAAISVIAERGYAAASATAIAITAEVAKGLIWRYFDDRDDLMRKTAEHIDERLRTEVVDQLDLSQPATDIVRQALHHLALLTRTHAAELRALDHIVHNLLTPEGDQRLSVHDYETGYRLQEELFARGIAEGSMNPADTRVMAVTYQGAIDAMLGYLTAHPELKPAIYAEQLANLLINGFGTRDHDVGPDDAGQ